MGVQRPGVTLERGRALETATQRFDASQPRALGVVSDCPSAVLPAPIRLGVDSLLGGEATVSADRVSVHWRLVVVPASRLGGLGNRLGLTLGRGAAGLFDRVALTTVLGGPTFFIPLGGIYGPFDFR